MSEWQQGACHCGAVTFRTRLAEPVVPARCTCSICAMKGIAMVGARIADFELLSGEALLSVYRFNTGVAQHFFCSHCGIYTHHQRRSDPTTYGINIECLEGMSAYDFAEMPVIDGINHVKDNGGTRRLAGVLRFEPAAE